MNKIFLKVYLIFSFTLSINILSQQTLDVGPLKEEQPDENITTLTGDNINIPLFTIKVGNIVYPISLIYQMTGVGVDQVAENVGLGWQLSTSFIYREIEDKIDVDEPNGGRYPVYSSSGYEGQSNVLHNSTINIPELKKKGYQTVKANNIIEHYNTNIGLLDHAPDVFNLNAPYFSTSFYFPDNKYLAKELQGNNSIITTEIKDILIDYTSFKHQNGQIPTTYLGDNRIFQDYTKFTLKQSNGVISTFDEPDFVHVINFARSIDRVGSTLYHPNQSDLYNAPFAEKWYLSNIVDPTTDRTVNFIYETFSTEDDHVNHYPNYESKNKPYFREGVYYKYNFKYPNAFVTDDCYIYKDPGENDDAAGESSRIYKRYIKKKRLQKIVFDGGTINFIYGLSRQDFHNDKALTRIEVRNSENKLVKSFDLTYDYFTSEQYRNEFSQRLKLTSITDLQGGKYSFEYYEDHKMPQIGSYNKDFYGYCNTGSDNIVNINDDSTVNSPIYYYYPDKYEYSIMPYNIAGQNKLLLEGVVNKEPNELAKTWSLKKIIYPTGGFELYNLETNTFNLWGENLKGPGIRIASKTIARSATDPKAQIISYNYNLENGNSSGNIYNFPLAGYPLKQLFSSYEDDYGNVISSGSTYNGEPNLYQSFFLYQALSRSKVSIHYKKITQTEKNKKVVNEYEIFTNKSKRYFRHFYGGNGINDFTPHCISEFLFTNSGVGKDNTG
ncbi:MAG TPA: hypothetical protein DEB37_04885, partial [Lysinibacillus sp.]|nr:hypothetical protein [Lysinibacillus sp.]